jgi:hypothetical protein
MSLEEVIKGSLFSDEVIVEKRIRVSSVHEAPDNKIVRTDDDGLFFIKCQQRVYVDSPEEVPEEYELQEGARGGLYYEMRVS